LKDVGRQPSYGMLRLPLQGSRGPHRVRRPTSGHLGEGQGPMLWLKKYIFAKKFSEKIGVFDSKQS
jgi:hypothetical protein